MKYNIPTKPVGFQGCVSSFGSRPVDQLIDEMGHPCITVSKPIPLSFSFPDMIRSNYA